MNYYSNENLLKASIYQFITTLSQIINHSIEFRPEFVKKNGRPSQTKHQYVLPILISDPLKLSGGCLPNFVIDIYKKKADRSNIEKNCEQNYYNLNENHSENIYMNRELSISEYDKLNRVVVACLYTLYKCILSFYELKKKSKKNFNKINKYIDTINHNTNSLQSFSRTIVTKKNRFQDEIFGNEFQDVLLVTKNTFSRIFKSFVGVTFKEYEKFCLQTLNENYVILKPYIDVIIELKHTPEKNSWKNLATEVLENSTLNKDYNNFFLNKNGYSSNIRFSEIKNVNLDYIKDRNSINILLPQTFSLKSYTSFSDERSRTKTKIRKNILLERIPQIHLKSLEKVDILLKLQKIKIKKKKTHDNNSENFNFNYKEDHSEYKFATKKVKNLKKSTIRINSKNQSFRLFKPFDELISSPIDKNSQMSLTYQEPCIEKFEIDNIELLKEFTHANLDASKININCYDTNNKDMTVLNNQYFSTYLNDQQKIEELKFQESYKIFCLNCKEIKVFENIFQNNDNKYKINPKIFFENWPVTNNKSLPLEFLFNHLPNLFYPIKNNSLDIIRQMLYNPENN